MRQDWYREYAETNGEEVLSFVGALEPGGDVPDAAATIRDAFRLDPDRRSGGTWEEALREMVRSIESHGVLVMRNGVVGNNTHRALDVEEFRGFTLSDTLAPLIFVNAKDTKSGQIFTLAHELIHVFLSRSGVSDATPRVLPDLHLERWCNQVAAELLVPIETFAREYRPEADLPDEM
jgi:Zn-dependent peptidase ImmA (M78 family)